MEDLFKTGFIDILILKPNIHLVVGSLPSKESLYDKTYFKGFKLSFNKANSEFCLKINDFGAARAKLETKLGI